MNNKDYLIVATLGETRNITRTAERLFMTQSAISKRIKLIEQEFSCDLHAPGMVSFLQKQGNIS